MNEYVANLKKPDAVFTRVNRKKAQRVENLMGFFFIGPMITGLTIFTLLPILATLYLSMTEWNFVAGFDKIEFIGLRNFSRLFQDPVFLQAMKNNVILLITIP